MATACSSLCARKLTIPPYPLYAVGVEAFSFAKFTRRHGSGETAAHYDPGDHEHVSTKPPEGYEKR
jgi:hypothetical protein